MWVSKTKKTWKYENKKLPKIRLEHTPSRMEALKPYHWAGSEQVVDERIINFSIH